MNLKCRIAEKVLRQDLQNTADTKKWDDIQKLWFVSDMLVKSTNPYIGVHSHIALLLTALHISIVQTYVSGSYMYMYIASRV